MRNGLFVRGVRNLIRYRSNLQFAPEYADKAEGTRAQ